jgi:hypothetical protein
MSIKDADEGRQIIPFATVLQQVAKGTAHTKLSELLAELTAAVRDHGKAGSLSITVKVEPTKGTSENLTVSITSTLKAPQATEASIFFSDDSGNLTRHDPRQIEAALHEVGTARRGETA